MPEYMLDTVTVSFALRGHGGVAARLLEHRPSQLCISAITVTELRYGAAVRKSRKLLRLIDTFVESVPVAPFDVAAANRFGSLAATLAGRGTQIGAYDTLIGAHALALGLVLVTNNTKHFQKVSGLKTENWV